MNASWSCEAISASVGPSDADAAHPSPLLKRQHRYRSQHSLSHKRLLRKGKGRLLGRPRCQEGTHKKYEGWQRRPKLHDICWGPSGKNILSGFYQTSNGVVSKMGGGASFRCQFGKPTGTLCRTFFGGPPDVLFRDVFQTRRPTTFRGRSNLLKQTGGGCNKWTRLFQVTPPQKYKMETHPTNGGSKRVRLPFGFLLPQTRVPSRDTSKSVQRASLPSFFDTRSGRCSMTHLSRARALEKGLKVRSQPKLRRTYEAKKTRLCLFAPTSKGYQSGAAPV